MPERTAAFPNPWSGFDRLSEGFRAKKTKLRPVELYCFRCKCPRKPAFGEADFIHDKRNSGLLTALCEECSTVTNKRISIGDLAKIEAVLRISFQDCQEAIGNRMKPF